jgi:hypothetical protein
MNSRRNLWTVLAFSLLFGSLLVTSGLVAAAPASAAHRAARTADGTECEPGTYSSTGFTPCTAAPPGTYVSFAGATSATPCPVGAYNP